MEKQSNIPFFRSWRFISFFPIFAVICFAAFLAWKQSNNLYLQKQHKISYTLALQVSQSVTQWLVNQVQFCNAFASMHVIRQMAENPTDDTVRLHASELLQGLHTKISEYTNLAVISFVHQEAFSTKNSAGEIKHIPPNSIVADSIDGKSIGTIDLNYKYIKAIHDGSTAYISESTPDIVQGRPQTFTITVPIKTKHNELIGCFLLTIKLDALTAFFNNMQLTQVGTIELINNHGTYINYFERAKIYNPLSKIQESNLLENITEHVRAFTIEDASETQWYYGTSKINHTYPSTTDWYVLYRRNANIFFYDQWKNASILIAIFGLLFISILLINFYLKKIKEKYFKKTYSHHEIKNMRLHDQHIACGVIVLDDKFHFMSVNPVAQEMLEYAHDDIHGTSFRLFFGETAYNDFLRKLITGDQITLRNIMITTLNEKFIFVDLFITPLIHEEQQYIITVMPVPATRELEERMKAIYEASPDVYIIISSSGTVLDCSDSCVAFLGAPSKDLIISDFLSFSPEVQSSGHLSIDLYNLLINQAADQGVSRQQWEHKTYASIFIPCEITLIRTSYNNQTTFIGCIRDMRVQKQFEDALKKEQNLMRKIFDAIPGTVALRDASSRYVAINKEFEAVFNVELEDVLGRMSVDIFSKETSAFAHRMDEDAVLSDDVVHGELTINIDQEDSPVYMITKKVLHTAEGEFDGILTIGFEISAQKAIERELIEAKARAEASNRSKTAFLSNISHEIRTPMNAIIGFVQLFSRNNLDDRQLSYLSKIKDAADILLAVINGVLELSKIEAGKLELESITFSPKDLIETLTSITTFAANEKHLPFEIFIDDELPEYLIGDPTRIKQILLNLINNAIKFTHTGHVLLTVDLYNYPSLPNSHVMIFFVIHDTGIGMSALQLKRIFKPFAQADASTTRKYGGTGLGLTICKQLAELMGGDITVQSILNTGTSFTLALPLEISSVTVEQQRKILDEYAQDKSIKGIRVLLVEDNKINQEITTIMLEQEGLFVDVAENGAEALEAVMAKQYDIILMDMQMPVMDGLEATTKLRDFGKTEISKTIWLTTVPIIAMTANAMLEDKQRCIKAGMDDHLAKPFEASDLYAIIRRYI